MESALQSVKVSNTVSGYSTLKETALGAGASAVEIIPANCIRVSSRFAALCKQPGCPSYGLAPGCPPHAMRPTVFSDLLAKYVRVLIFKKDVPREYLLDQRRLAVAKAIHRIAAGVEMAALAQGLSGASGFAAGSCKELFCPDISHCVVLGEGQPCLYPDVARPSVSAVGVDVTDLCNQLGWELIWSGKGKDGQAPSPTALMLGLVLLE